MKPLFIKISEYIGRATFVKSYSKAEFHLHKYGKIAFWEYNKTFWACFDIRTKVPTRINKKLYDYLDENSEQLSKTLVITQPENPETASEKPTNMELWMKCFLIAKKTAKDKDKAMKLANIMYIKKGGEFNELLSPRDMSDHDFVNGDIKISDEVNTVLKKTTNRLMRLKNG